MKILKLYGNICLIILMMTATGYSRERFQASINFAVDFPQGEFKENVDRAGFGVSGNFLYNFPRIPVSVGASVNFLVYGREKREEPLILTIPDIYVDVITTNNILICHFMLRVQPPEGKVRPYLDGLFGFNYLWTETAISGQDGTDGDAIARTVHSSDFALSYGAGGGLMIRVLERKKGKYYAVFIELGACYLKGGRAEYMKKGSFYQENGQVLYEISESTTDLIAAHVGVNFVF